MKQLLITLALIASVSAKASLLTYEAGTLQLNGVNLNKTATINDAAGAPTALKMDLLGAGLRSKTVLIVEAKVYVAQLFSDNKAGFSRDANALTSLVKNSSRIALKINMLRTVSAVSLAQSFREALQANGYVIDTELTNILALFEKSAEATSGKSLSLLMKKDATANKVNVYYEDTTGKTQSVVAAPEVMIKILSIWLGKPADSGLEKLKASLLKPVYEN